MTLPRVTFNLGLLLSLVTACGDGGDDVVTTAPDTSVVGDTTATDPTDTTVTTSPGDSQTANDPCRGVPLTGQCRAGAIERCVVGTGSSEPYVDVLTCPGGTTCVTDVLGATCQLTVQCLDGARECHGDRLAECGNGQWIETACPRGCVDTVLDASCRTALPTVRYHNTFTYELRTPNADFSDWSAEPVTVPGVGFLVASIADGEIQDVVVTADDGSFELDVVRDDVADDDDFLVLVPMRVKPDESIAYAVLEPDVTAGTHAIESTLQGSGWYWSWTPQDVPADGGVFLGVEAGSGVAHAFDYLRAVYDFGEGFYGTRARSSIAMWLGFGVDWDCGACFAPAPVRIDGSDFDNQIWMGGDDDEAYWSGPVLAHELGHWLMSTFGQSPGEGGRHVVGVPSHPGLAWSEGFATYFSDLVRDEAYYYDKQGGLFFWIDHASRTTSSGVAWQRPVASRGLEQLIDENEVTRMLLALTTEQNLDGMLAALTSPRMLVSPFLRGYERRTWDGLDGEDLPLPYESTGVSAPHLADFLDALTCDAVVTRAALDAVTEPSARYPFPSQAPLCREATLPLEVRWSASGELQVAELRWLAALDADVDVTVVDRRRPSEPLVPVRRIARGRAAGSERVTWRRSDVDVALRVAADGPGWHLRGVVPFARPAAVVPARDGPRLRARGHTWAPSVRVKPR